MDAPFSQSLTQWSKAEKASGSDDAFAENCCSKPLQIMATCNITLLPHHTKESYRWTAQYIHSQLNKLKLSRPTDYPRWVDLITSCHVCEIVYVAQRQGLDCSLMESSFPSSNPPPITQLPHRTPTFFQTDH